VRVLAFLGGTFVFAGIGIFVAVQWNDLNPASRVVVTLGSGLAVFVLATLASRDARFAKAATPLLLIAAILEPTGMLVAFDEFGSGGDWRWAGLITAATMALQFGATYLSIRRTAPIGLAMLFATLFWWTALDLMDMRDRVIALVVGSTMILTAIGFGRTRHRHMTPPWYLVGAVACLAGLFGVVRRTPVEIVFLAAAAGFVYLSVVVHSRSLLIAATLAIVAYTGWFTSEHFLDSVGWPLALIVFGLAMIALSALAVRIDRNYLRRTTG
jgi:hypothetical protein